VHQFIKDVAATLQFGVSKMSAVNFMPEKGGHIDFQYDAEKFYAVSQHGTSVPLWEGELIFVPKKGCECSNPACTVQESHFVEEEVRGCYVPPVSEHSDSQEYAGKYSCWASVQLFDQDKVDAACPAGFLPAIATFQNGVFHVHRFLWND